MDLEKTFETSKNHPKESTNNEEDKPSEKQKKIPTNTSIDGDGEHDNVNDENTNTENQKPINNTDDKIDTLDSRSLSLLSPLELLVAHHELKASTSQRTWSVNG